MSLADSAVTEVAPDVVAANDEVVDEEVTSTTTLFVTNLDFSTTEETIEKLFSVAQGFRKVSILLCMTK